MKTTLFRFLFLALVVTTGLTGCTGYVPATTSVGVAVGPRPYGYGYGGYGYGYRPYYRPYYYRPPVIVAPRPYYYRTPVPRFYGGGRGYGRGGRHW